jgi:anti-anti-sigma factor
MKNSEIDGVSVVELDGRIVLGDESNSVRERLKGLITGGKKKIVLNMSNIKYIDSAGLGALVAAHVSAKTQGASVRLCNLGQSSTGFAGDSVTYRFRRLRHTSRRREQFLEPTCWCRDGRPFPIATTFKAE